MAVQNVRDFGAYGDGVHDDTAAVQAALDAGGAAGGGVVLVPQGTYRLTETLTVYPRLSLQGEGDQVSVLHQANPEASGLHGVDVSFLDVRGLQLRGPGTDSASGPGIYLSRDSNPNCEAITMENVFVWQFGDSGVAISLPIASTFTRVIAQQNGAFGISLYGGGTSCTLTSCYANGNGQIGYHIGLVYSHFSGCAADSNGIGYYAGPGSRNVTFSACGAEDSISRNSTCDGTAWKIDGADDVVLSGCYAATSSKSFWVTGSARSATLISCTEANPAAGATASFQVDPGCSATVAGWSYATPPDLAPGTTTIVSDGAGNMTVPGSLRVGGTGLAHAAGALTAAFTVAGSTAETAVAGLTVPAGEAAAGNLYHLLAFGVFTAAGNSPTLTPAVRWGGPGGAALTSTAATAALAAGATRPWRMEAWVNFVSATSCYAMLHFEYGTGAASVTILELPAPAEVTGLATGADTALALTLRWSKTGTSAFTVQGATAHRWS